MLKIDCFSRCYTQCRARVTECQCFTIFTTLLISLRKSSAYPVFCFDRDLLSRVQTFFYQNGFECNCVEKEISPPAVKPILATFGFLQTAQLV